MRAWTCILLLASDCVEPAAEQRSSLEVESLNRIQRDLAGSIRAFRPAATNMSTEDWMANTSVFATACRRQSLKPAYWLD